MQTLFMSVFPMPPQKNAHGTFRASGPTLLHAFYFACQFQTNVTQENNHDKVEPSLGRDRP
jgi:hypothetical protein